MKLFFFFPIQPWLLLSSLLCCFPQIRLYMFITSFSFSNTLHYLSLSLHFYIIFCKYLYTCLTLFSPSKHFFHGYHFFLHFSFTNTSFQTFKTVHKCFDSVAKRHYSLIDFYSITFPVIASQTFTSYNSAILNLILASDTPTWIDNTQHSSLSLSLLTLSLLFTPSFLIINLHL